MTTYEFILCAKDAHLWEGCLQIFSRANTLDRYFQVYAIFLQTMPDKPRGYLHKMLDNPFVIRELGTRDVVLLKWAIHQMEQSI